MPMMPPGRTSGLGSAGSALSLFGGPVGLGAGLGLNLLGGLFGISSERNRRRKLQSRLLRELQPLEAQLATRRFGLSQGEGLLANQAVQGTLGNLSERGLVGSSFAAPAVAQAIAPFEVQRERDVDDMLRQLISARQQIFAGTAMPGFGAAFGNAFGEAGDLLSFLQGLKAIGG